jgi:coenzyme F420-reducing hydrogenase delta subunit
MVAVCPDEKCEHNGNLRAKERVEDLRNTMEKIGIDPERLQLVQIVAGDKGKFQAEIDTFVDRLNTLGPIR